MGHLCLSFGPSRQSGCWLQYFLFLFISVFKNALEMFHSRDLGAQSSEPGSEDLTLSGAPRRAREAGHVGVTRGCR